MGSCSTLIKFLRTSAVALFVYAALSAAVQAACAPTEVLVKGAFGEVSFSVELADEPDERAQGLMHRSYMARGAGMLFVFERPQPAAFWMKNTFISLDMLFVDEKGVIRKIHENAVPLDETPILGGEGIFAVLEINGGLSARLGIAPGDAIQHPAFSQQFAAIPCNQ